jgi:UTP--glucose-1-phosphate uridylyltransferase
MSLPSNPSDRPSGTVRATVEADLDLFVQKMKSSGASSGTIASFSGYYRQLRSGKRGLLPESAITPIRSDELLHLHDLSPYEEYGRPYLSKTVVIKLNGGLGTTMGCNGPKSLITVKNNFHFLDIAAQQLLHTAKISDSPPPLLLMNSFITEKQSLKALQKYPELVSVLPRSFLQNKFPRIDVETMTPVNWPQAPHLEWNPPGHGDIYSALQNSGLLEQILEKGFRYAFISNIDNLGASLNTALLGYLASEKIELLMEVTERTAMDRKGGHIARAKTGNLLLRESIQCPADDLMYFQDIYRHRFFNTNNLWIDLEVLHNKLTGPAGALGLPLLCNRKFLDPSDPQSPVVYQLESAMGSALSVFSKTDVIAVPRFRFIPVKSCEDLLLLWSDYYTLSEDFSVLPFTEKVNKNPEIILDSRYFGTVDLLNTRFPKGGPSLRNCRRLTIEGNVFFGRNISISGDVTISNQAQTAFEIPDDSIIQDDLHIGN